MALFHSGESNPECNTIQGRVATWVVQVHPLPFVTQTRTTKQCTKGVTKAMKKDLISKQQVIEILDATITQCEAALDYNVNDEIAHHELRAVHAVLRSLRQKVTQLRSMDREILVTRNTQLHIKFQ